MDAEHEIEKMKEIHDWHVSLIDKHPPLEVVEAIRARRRAGAPGEDAWLASVLQLQLVIAALGLEKEAEAVMDEMIERLPDDVQFPIAMTSFHRRHRRDAESARESSEVALTRAERTGCFRREVLGTRARIFLDLRRYDELNQTLEAIMALEIKPDCSDIPPERDFVDDAPPGAIRPDVLARYNAFRPKADDE
jgi:hypothetical protein